METASKNEVLIRYLISNLIPNKLKCMRNKYTNNETIKILVVPEYMTIYNNGRYLLTAICEKTMIWF